MTLRTALVLSGDAKGAVAAIETAVDAVERLEHANEQASREAKALAAAEQAAMSAAASAAKLADDEARKAAAAQARLVASYDPVIAKQRKLVESLADIHKLYKAGAITAEEMTRAVERQQAVYSRVPRGGGPAPANPVPAAGEIALSNQQLGQMQFQLNDLAVQLASGSSPFIAITQQGSQIAQMFSAGTGPTAAIKALGAGVTAFVTNPLNLMVVGIAAASAAIPMIWSAFTGSDAASAEDRLANISDWIKTLEKDYDGAAAAARRFEEAARARSVIELKGVQEQKKAVEDLAAQISSISGGLVQQALFGANQIRADEIRELAMQLRDGALTAEQFQKKMSEIALRPEANARVVDLASGLATAAEKAVLLERAANGASAALAQLRAGRPDGQIDVRVDAALRDRFAESEGDTILARLREQAEGLSRQPRGAAKAARDAERAAEQRAMNAEAIAGYEAELAALSLTGSAREAALRQLEIERDTRAAIKALGDEAGAAEIARIETLIPAIAAQTQAMERQKELLEEQERAAQKVASGFASVATQIARGADVADTLLSKVLDIGSNLVSEGFQSLFGGGRSSGGGILSTLFRAAVPAAAPALAPGAAGNPFAISSLYHDGGIAGRPTGMSRAVPWAVFDNAPRAHSGGRAALAPGEVPVIAKEGEEIGWPGQLAAKYGGGRQIVINNTINAPYAQPGVVEQIDARLAEFNRTLPARIAEIDANPRGR